MSKTVYLNTPQEIITALREGQIIKEDHGEAEYGMVDGIICRRARGHKWSGLNAAITFVGKHLYFEDTRVQLEVGRIYETLSGRRVFIVAATALYYYGALENWGKGFICYNEHGHVVEVDAHGKTKEILTPEQIVKELEK